MIPELSFKKITVALSAALLAGCSLAPDYSRPDAPVAASWSQKPEANAVDAASMDWQTFVTDPKLRGLITASLAENRNLRQTLLNVEAARLQYHVQRADQVPSLQLQGTGTRQRTPADLSASGQPGVQSTWQAGAGFTSFEIDLFGRLRNLSEAALEEYLATDYGSRNARISLISEIIQTYVNRNGALSRFQLSEDTLHNREASLKIISARRSAGTAAEQDYQEALGLTEQARAELERADRDLQQSTNALVLLAGVPDISVFLNQKVSTKPFIQQSLAPGAPSGLLENRPDIIASEHRLRARNADIGAARAAFFPRISLTGVMGTSSADLSGLFSGGQGMWSFTPQIDLPIFSGGRNKSNLELANLRKDVAVATYEQTVQTAFREVADALVATETLRKEEDARQALVTSNNRALMIARARYQAGVDDYLRYLDAERSSFTNQLVLINTEIQRQQAIVSLFTATGGGWKFTEHWNN